MRPPQPQLSWQQLRQDGVGSGGSPGPGAGDGLGVLHLPHRLVGPIILIKVEALSYALSKKGLEDILNYEVFDVD